MYSQFRLTIEVFGEKFHNLFDTLILSSCLKRRRISYNTNTLSFPLSLLSLPFILSRAMAGGWSSAVVTDAEIVKCAEFAMAKGSFASQSVAKFVVTSARMQVVAGLNVEMTVDVHIDGKCFVRNFQVYDRFGTLSLTRDEAVEGSSCTTK